MRFSCKRIPFFIKQVACRDYCNTSKTAKEIANEYDFSEGTLHRSMKSYEVYIKSLQQCMSYDDMCSLFIKYEVSDKPMWRFAFVHNMTPDMFRDMYECYKINSFLNNSNTNTNFNEPNYLESINEIIHIDPILC